jgi:hypothetical protein
MADNGLKQVFEKVGIITAANSETKECCEGFYLGLVFDHGWHEV